MTRETAVERKISEAVKKNAPHSESLIASWIHRALTGNDFIVADIKNARFTFTDINTMRFTAIATVYTGRDFNKSITAKFVWQLRGKKLSSSLVENKAI